jgi:hypothetical protein
MRVLGVVALGADFERILAAAILTLCFSVTPTIGSTMASAMDFSLQQMSDGTKVLQVVVANGEIVSGDIDRLRIALQSADRDRFGNKNLALNSGGGLVREALAMVALMDQQKVTTIVPPGAACASACAQIIFLAGVQRVVLDGGRLGMHTCSVNGDSAPLCNEIIAQTALEHGTAYGSVMAFMKYTGASKMIWFNSEDADCYGLTRWPPGINRGTQPGEIGSCFEKSIREQLAR